jgi:hypothetical protein
VALQRGQAKLMSTWSGFGGRLRHLPPRVLLRTGSFRRARRAAPRARAGSRPARCARAHPSR